MLCWGEVRYLTQDDEFEEGVAEWEIFRPCPEELGCDIRIIELTSEELRLVTEGSEASETSQSCTAVLKRHQNQAKKVTKNPNLSKYSL